jgi:arsenate reductase-like glutaredoxin family protein
MTQDNKEKCEVCGENEHRLNEEEVAYYFPEIRELFVSKRELPTLLEQAELKVIDERKRLEKQLIMDEDMPKITRTRLLMRLGL